MEYTVIFLPLIGAIIGYLGGSLLKYFSEIATSLLVSISAALSILLFLHFNNGVGFQGIYI